MENTAKKPLSVAVIMDGNGRWAQQRGLERFEGHLRGVESLRDTIKAALICDVQYLTVYAFSTENWGRPQDEVDALMELLGKSIIAETPALKEQNVRVRFIGDRTRLSEELQKNLGEMEQQTAECDRMTFVVAINYSSRDEIKRAMQHLATKVANAEIKPADIDEEMICNSLDTSGMRDPDLVIRTSGEQRLSNYLLWQTAYSEFYFTPTLWPDFGVEEFKAAVAEYGERNRRFGLVL